MQPSSQMIRENPEESKYLIQDSKRIQRQTKRIRNNSGEFEGIQVNPREFENNLGESDRILKNAIRFCKTKQENMTESDQVLRKSGISKYYGRMR